MRLVLPLVAALVLAVAPFPAQHADAGDPAKPLVDQPAPPLGARSWIGGDGRGELDEYRGEVVLAVFWSTRCASSCAQITPLERLQERHGDRGLSVVGVTSDPIAAVRRYLLREQGRVGYTLAVADAPGYGVRAIPYAFLVGPDGRVQWQGPPGELPERKVLRPLLGEVRRATPEEQEARVRAAIDRAERLAADGLVFAAARALDAAADRWPRAEGARTATARARELTLGEHADEYAAQARVAKLGGGPDGPREPLDEDERRSRATALLRLADDVRDEAPRAARWAQEWAALLEDPPR